MLRGHGIFFFKFTHPGRGGAIIFTWRFFLQIWIKSEFFFITFSELLKDNRLKIQYRSTVRGSTLPKKKLLKNGAGKIMVPLEEYIPLDIMEGGGA